MVSDAAGEGPGVDRRFRRMKLLVATLVISGLVIQSAGTPWLRTQSALTTGTVVLMQTAGLLFQVLACVLYLRLKGREAWLGAFGILGLPAVVVIFLLDKRCHRCGSLEKHNARSCTRCGAPV
jgi:hypothetical protein